MALSTNSPSEISDLLASVGSLGIGTISPHGRKRLSSLRDRPHIWSDESIIQFKRAFVSLRNGIKSLKNCLQNFEPHPQDDAPLTGSLFAVRILSDKHGGVVMTVVSYGDVLKAAHRLPRDAQVELATALLRSVKSQPRRKASLASTAVLEPLPGMSTGELNALAEAIVAPGKQALLQALLEKNRDGALDPEEEAALDELLAQVDQVGLLKARAQYTLHLTQEAGELPE